MDQLFRLLVHRDSAIIEAFNLILVQPLTGKSYQKVVTYIVKVRHWGPHFQARPSGVD